MGCTQGKSNESKKELQKQPNQNKQHTPNNDPLAIVDSNIKSDNKKELKSSNDRKNKKDETSVDENLYPEIITPPKSQLLNFQENKQNSLSKIHEVSQKKEQTEQNLQPESQKLSKVRNFEIKSPQSANENSFKFLNLPKEEQEQVYEESIQDYGQTTISPNTELEIKVRF